jgi:hypothetical protein
VLFDALVAVRKSVRGFSTLRAAALVPLLVPDRFAHSARDDAGLLALSCGACASGASVWLSNGDAAVVLSENPTHPMKPVVLATSADDEVPEVAGSDARVIDLARATDVAVQAAFSFPDQIGAAASATKTRSLAPEPDEAEEIDPVADDADEPMAAEPA